MSPSPPEVTACNIFRGDAITKEDIDDAAEVVNDGAYNELETRKQKIRFRFVGIEA